MIVKGLSSFDPAVVVIADPLSWPEPKPDTIPSLAQALLPIPSVVLGVQGDEKAVADDASLAFDSDYLPSVEKIDGTKDAIAPLPALTGRPESALLPQKELGVVTGANLRFAYRQKDRVVPSLLLAALTRSTRTPYSNQALRTGPGAGAHLGGDWFVPLEKDGTYKAAPLPVPSVNALELMTSNMVDPDPATTKTLGKGRIIVLGIDNDGEAPTLARSHVQALAGALVLPRVREISFTWQVVVWVIAGLAGLSLLLLPKKKAVLRTLGLLFVILLASYIAFQVGLVWCPPTVAVGLLVFAGLYVRIFGFDPNKPKNRKSGKFYVLR